MPPSFASTSLFSLFRAVLATISRYLGTTALSHQRSWKAAKPAVAHHALQAEFDTAKRGEFTGTLTKFALINPHVRWFFEEKKPDGKPFLKPFPETEADIRALGESIP